MKLLQNFVNGVWIDSESDARSDVINPATGEIIARVPLSSSEDVEALS